MSTLIKNLIVALVITAALGAGYYFFLGSSDEELYQDVSGTSDISVRTAKILEDTRKINEYELDDSIFTDRRFLSLKDFRVFFEDVPTGRDNPFEPVD